MVVSGGGSSVTIVFGFTLWSGFYYLCYFLTTSWGLFFGGQYHPLYAACHSPPSCVFTPRGKMSRCVLGQRGRMRCSHLKPRVLWELCRIERSPIVCWCLGSLLANKLTLNCIDWCISVLHFHTIQCCITSPAMPHFFPLLWYQCRLLMKCCAFLLDDLTDSVNLWVKCGQPCFFIAIQ